MRRPVPLNVAVLSFKCPYGLASIIHCFRRYKPMVFDMQTYGFDPINLW